jgi:nucleoside 2-deoxyribosyltransferase
VKVYLAGPEVFSHDAPVIFEKAVKFAKEIGLVPLSPFDAVPASHVKNDVSMAKKIYQGNVGLIDECDVVVANLSSFRGSEPDSGTVFEVGYAIARGKKVIAFIEQESHYYEKVMKVSRIFRDESGGWRDEQQRWVEEMGMQFNLMIACSVDKIVIGSIEHALLAAARLDLTK